MATSKYELQQSTLLNIENELLRDKIVNLNQEIRMLKAELRMFGITKELDDKIHNSIVNGTDRKGIVNMIESYEKK